ncbi:MAG: EAL domain-containing protein [Hyphomicrobiales bacterium]|nr:EAL domain-containing protein [Hyphomicrobiales bacterium]
MSISTIDLPARGWLPDVARRGHFRRVPPAGEPGVLRLLAALAVLQTLPFDKLKVDRSFVTALDRSANGGVLIQTVVALGRALGKGIVIEGVETKEQRVLRRIAGCHEMQGFLFAKAMPAEGIDQLLAERGSTNAAARARSRLRA